MTQPSPDPSQKEFFHFCIIWLHPSIPICGSELLCLYFFFFFFNITILPRSFPSVRARIFIPVYVMADNNHQCQPQWSRGLAIGHLLILAIDSQGHNCSLCLSQAYKTMLFTATEGHQLMKQLPTPIIPVTINERKEVSSWKASQWPLYP